MPVDQRSMSNSFHAAPSTTQHCVAFAFALIPNSIYHNTATAELAATSTDQDHPNAVQYMKVQTRTERFASSHWNKHPHKNEHRPQNSARLVGRNGMVVAERLVASQETPSTASTKRRLGVCSAKLVRQRPQQRWRLLRSVRRWP